MKSERFKRTKSVMASGAVALVVAALAFGVSSSVLGTKSAIAQRLGFDLTSGSSSFTITSSIYPSPACSGSTALLYPGTPRCMVFSVHNNLSVPISVGSITSALDTTDYPAPPPACAGTNLTLPTYSGSLAVPANGDATSSGVPHRAERQRLDPGHLSRPTPTTSPTQDWPTTPTRRRRP